METNAENRSGDDYERGDGERDFQFFPLRAEDECAIADLGIGVPDFLFFRMTFVGSPWTYATRRLTDARWSLRRRYPLSTRLLIEHLRGARWIATGAKKISRTHHFVANWFALDLDLKDDAANLNYRYDAVQRAFGKPSLVFRSSSSGGLHLYYVLDDLVHLHQLRRPDGDGVVRRLLRSVGLDEQSGHVEVYPRGQYAVRGVGNRLRLPFGAGSRLLEVDGLTPAAASRRPLEDLKLVHRQFADGKIALLDSKELIERGWASGAPTTTCVRRLVVRAAHEDIAAREGYVERLKATGLTEKNEFNRAVSALAFDGLWNGATAEEVTAWIEAWLERGFHNGCSDTYCKNPKSALREVSETVRRIFARHRPSQWGKMPAVAESDVRRLLDATSGDVISDPTTGEILNRFKVQRFAFELLRRAKQYVLAIGNRTWIRSHDVTGAGEKELLSAIRSVWPDPPSDDFIVACPYALRVSVPLVTEATVGPCWNAVKEAGLFRLEVPAAWPKPMCERYRARLQFSATEHHFESLEAATRTLLDRRDVKRLYTRSHARRILATVLPDIQRVPSPTEFEAFLERQLAARRVPRAA